MAHSGQWKVSAVEMTLHTKAPGAAQPTRSQPKEGQNHNSIKHIGWQTHAKSAIGRNRLWPEAVV